MSRSKWLTFCNFDLDQIHCIELISLCGHNTPAADTVQIISISMKDYNVAFFILLKVILLCGILALVEVWSK